LKNTREKDGGRWPKVPGGVVNSGSKKLSRGLAPKSAKSKFRRQVQSKSKLPITFLGRVRNVDVSKNRIGVRGIALFWKVSEMSTGLM
jgi:hypothetical protein